MFREMAFALSDRILGLAPDQLLSHAAKGDMWSRIKYLKAEGFAPEQVVDVGAYEGRWTSECASIFPNAKFLMVEAQEIKEGALKAVCQRLGGRASYQIGLAAAVEGADKVFFEMETGSSYFEEMTEFPRRTVTKKTTTLKSILALADIQKVDFLKLDVQGAELEVLAGGIEYLSSAKYVLLEVALSDYNRNAPNAGDVISFMASNGFKLRDIADVKRSSRGKPVNQMDAIFSAR